ncbi:DUF5709 domain-containing protein [Aestuariimicrobium ganziense]|uniref:DUF5709 domain-containing protein n=1 Tax=Aestuariimicrobium ganziense TaxID=2773677 RepID=UPI0019419A1E|nr:DUF5709 domain-containing protein [Aestuariimicrobium ganziense]
MEAIVDTDEMVPEESEQLDQLQSDDTLIRRGVEDVLDEGWVAPDNYSAAERFGNTAEEQRQGETLEMRLAQEEPEVEASDDYWNAAHEPREVGRQRAGRLVAPGEGYDGPDDEDQEVGHDVGFAGGAACAEEAAMHVFTPDEPDEDDWR